jgi:hypothetical protein
MTDYRNPAWTEESRFRVGLDDVIIIPLVFVTLAANKILRSILSILMRLLDYAFPLAMQIVWLPLLAAKVLGNVIVTAINGALRLLPLSEAKRRRWSISIRRNWSRLRLKFSYRAFERAVHDAFEDGMAWVFGRCRHLTPNAALLVIMGAVLWLPMSFAAATAMHAGVVCQDHVLASLDATLAPVGNGHREEQAFGAAGVPGGLATGQKKSVRSARIQGL